MPKSPPVVTRQTSKQAKAAFKARGRPSLSEAEKKQLERAVELDRRAWRTKEQEKRKLENVRKRQEKERREKEERQKAALGTQRRCDRFGYKSSQFHLGAFFGAGAVKEGVPLKEEVMSEEDEAFDDGEVDDETLLDALESPNPTKGRQQHPQSDAAVPSLSQWSGLCVQRSVTEPPPTSVDELGDFWNELGSSTQIARELSSEPYPDQETRANARTASFNSGDFDLSAEDMEELEPPKPVVSKAEQDRKLMPPPALPIKFRTEPTMNFAHPSPEPAIAPSCFIDRSSTYRSDCAGFTMTELEDFMDDDLQLTQAAPG